MKGIQEVSHHKEAELEQLRNEVQSLQIVACLLSNDPIRNAYDVLRQKEADLARVRKEVESLQMVAPLLSDELAADELAKKPASSAQETMNRSNDEEATGTDDLFPSMKASPRPKFWEMLKRKT